MTHDTNVDILIIGSGPGGYMAAIRAAQLGFRTAIVERSYLGGICLNWGCIPTKALLRSAELFHDMQHAADFGLSAGPVGYDAAGIVNRSRKIAQRLNDGVGYLMKKNKIAVIWGEAFIDAPGEVTVKPSAAQAPKGALGAGAYRAEHIIVATGARPRVLPGVEPNKTLIWTYFEAMVPDHMPKSLLIIGSGAIGIEFASFYRSFGAEVTVVETLPRILPSEDDEIATLARKSLERRGITFRTGATVAKLDLAADRVTATIETDGASQTLVVERVITAIGVTGNIENLGLEALGVETERGIIKIDRVNRTNVPGLYAIGDVSGQPMLAHKAEYEGVVCVEAIKGLNPQPMDRRMIPACTYSMPQLASVGLTEQAAGADGLRDPGRAFSLCWQRQGDRDGRGSGAGQGDLRRGDRSTAGRAHDRVGRHRIDRGVCGGDEPRNHGRTADAHRVPTSDPVRNDEGSCARCLWTGDEHVTGYTADSRH